MGQEPRTLSFAFRESGPCVQREPFGRVFFVIIIENRKKTKTTSERETLWEDRERHVKRDVDKKRYVCRCLSVSLLLVSCVCTCVDSKRLRACRQNARVECEGKHGVEIRIESVNKDNLSLVGQNFSWIEQVGHRLDRQRGRRHRAGNFWDEVRRFCVENECICFCEPIIGSSTTTKTYLCLLIFKNYTYSW